MADACEASKKQFPFGNRVAMDKKALPLFLVLQESVRLMPKSIYKFDTLL